MQESSNPANLQIPIGIGWRRLIKTGGRHAGEPAQVLGEPAGEPTWGTLLEGATRLSPQPSFWSVFQNRASCGPWRPGRARETDTTVGQMLAREETRVPVGRHDHVSTGAHVTRDPILYSSAQWTCLLCLEVCPRHGAIFPTDREGHRPPVPWPSHVPSQACQKGEKPAFQCLSDRSDWLIYLVLHSDRPFS